jgi:hypothetical protein
MRRLKILFAKLTVLIALINFPGVAFALTFTNGGAISLPSSASASPYPSLLEVSVVPEAPPALYMGLAIFVGAAVLRRYFRKP